MILMIKILLCSFNTISLSLTFAHKFFPSLSLLFCDTTDPIASQATPVIIILFKTFCSLFSAVKRTHRGKRERKYDSSPESTTGHNDSAKIGVWKGITIPHSGHGNNDIPPSIAHVVTVHVGLHHGSFEYPHDESEHNNGRYQKQRQ